MPPPTIASALQAAVEELGWSPTKLAAEAGVNEITAKRWLTGEAAPSGDSLLLLMREHMVVRERLLGAA